MWHKSIRLFCTFFICLNFKYVVEGFIVSQNGSTLEISNDLSFDLNTTVVPFSLNQDINTNDLMPFNLTNNLTLPLETKTVMNYQTSSAINSMPFNLTNNLTLPLETKTVMNYQTSSAINSMPILTSSQTAQTTTSPITYTISTMTPLASSAIENFYTFIISTDSTPIKTVPLSSTQLNDITSQSIALTSSTAYLTQSTNIISSTKSFTGMINVETSTNQTKTQTSEPILKLFAKKKIANKTYASTTLSLKSKKLKIQTENQCFSCNQYLLISNLTFISNFKLFGDTCDEENRIETCKLGYDHCYTVRFGLFYIRGCMPENSCHAITNNSTAFFKNNTRGIRPDYFECCKGALCNMNYKVNHSMKSSITLYFVFSFCIVSFLTIFY
jgi:hypothetical protein